MPPQDRLRILKRKAAGTQPPNLHARRPSMREEPP